MAPISLTLYFFHFYLILRAKVRFLFETGKKIGRKFRKNMVGYIKISPRRGKITTRYKKLVYFVTPVRKARLQVFLLLFAPFGDDWREYCSYPQVPFPSVIPPAVIESWPPSGTGGYLRNLSAL